MAGRPWTDQEIQLLTQLAAEGLSDKGIAAQLGRTTAAVAYKLKHGNIPRHKEAEGSKEMFSHNVTASESAMIVSVSRKIKSAEDACKYGQVDRTVWDIAKSRVSSSETAMKMSDGSVKVVPLWHISVELKRKYPQRIGDALEGFISRIRKHAPAVAKPPRKRKTGDSLLEVSVFDAHFGKRCWGAQTGTNYDTPIAERMFANAIDDLIGSVGSQSIGKVLFPIGQDFFNVDNWQDTTHAGTPQDTDDRFQKVFVSGLMAIISATEKLSHLAPVEIVWVPGNHDMTTSWYLANCLKERFHATKHIEVDVSPSTRKYVQWGCTMLMLLHGDTEKETDLGAIAATEKPTLWADTTWREAHCGHFHKKRELKSVDIDEHHGFRVRRLPSLSGTDRWHYSKGYVGGQRCAEAYLFSRESGFLSMYNAIARD